MKANDKSKEIDALLSSLAGGANRYEVVEAGLCMTCEGRASQFRDALSEDEYRISGMCQDCQDDVFGISDEEPEDYEDDEQAFTSAGMGMDESYYPQEDFGFFGEAGLWD